MADKTNDLALAKNFEFKTTDKWLGYNSANDKTNLAENVIVGGSQNMYKKLSGNWSVRPGLKRQGLANETQSGVPSEFVWNTSWGATYILTVSDGTLWVVVDEVWYPLLGSGVFGSELVVNGGFNGNADGWSYDAENWSYTGHRMLFSGDVDSQTLGQFITASASQFQVKFTVEFTNDGIMAVFLGEDVLISIDTINLDSSFYEVSGSYIYFNDGGIAGNSYDVIMNVTTDPEAAEGIDLRFRPQPNDEDIIFNGYISAVSIQELGTTPPLTSTRYVFDKWWDAIEQRDRVLFVHGDSELQNWSGGFTTVASTTNSTGIIVSIDPDDITGTGYTIGDILTIAGGADGTIRVLTVNGSGVIQTIELVTRGSGYSAGSGQATTGGTGTGATVTITAVGNSSITKNDPEISWQQAGFITSNAFLNEKRILINGTEYSYLSGEDTDTLVGISPDPSSIPIDSVAIQSVSTNDDTPAAGFNNDFLKVINNQVYIGSYTSRLCYISSNSDWLDYTVTTPRLPGGPELLTLDATLNGIGVRTGQAHISIGQSEWAVISFQNITVGTTLTQQTIVDIKPVANLAAAYAHEFIDNVGDNIVYLAKDQQVRTFGDFNNLFVAAYPSLSQEIATELKAENFMGGGLRCIADFTYVTSPNSGKTYLYQVRQAVDSNNQVIVERLWHSPFIWNATRIDEVNGVVISFSNSNPQIYEVWDTGQYFDDSPSGESLPYSCTLALSYRTGGRRQGLVSFDKVFSEGYIALGTPLDLTVNYNYQGSTAQRTVPINSTERPATLFGSSTTETIRSLGDSSLGDKSLGDDGGSSNTGNLAKFKVINSLALVNCFEYQPVYSSDAVGAQWEILANGTNVHIDEQDATFIINKQRNV